MFRGLRHRNFQLFFGGQLISLVGTWMQTLAQSWLVYKLTHSAALLGAVAFAAQIPVLFLGPIAGIVADRHRRHRIVIATQTAMMIQSLLMAALTLAHLITVSEIFVLAFLLGLCNAYDIPARQSFLVEMVGSEDLMNAIALNSSIFNSARIVGPAIAGILVAKLGEGMCFLINGLSFIAVIVGLLLMKISSPRPDLSGAGKFQQLKEGLRYASRNVAMRSLLVLLGVISLLGMSYVVLMPIFADQILHSGARGLGWLMTSSGFGALLAALWLASRKHVLGLDRVVALASMGFGVSLILFSVSRMFWLSFILLVPAGFCLMVQMAATNTLIQSIVSNDMRGRVMGLYTMMFLGMAPFGSLLAGFLAQHFSAPAALLVGGSACIVSAGVFGLRLRHLKIDDHLASSFPEASSDGLP
jgi:MFS family permease